MVLDRRGHARLSPVELGWVFEDCIGSRWRLTACVSLSELFFSIKPSNLLLRPVRKPVEIDGLV